MSDVEAPGRVTLWRILRESGRAWRRDFFYISLLAAMVEAPIILIDLGIAARQQELPNTDEGFGVSWGSLAVVVGGMFAHYFLAAVIETVESSERHGHGRPTFMQLATTLPWKRLIVADILLRVATVIGYVLLILPGVVISAYTQLTLPLVNMERKTVRESIRRSVTLVQGRLRIALAVWALITFIDVALAELVGELFESLTHSHTGEFFAHLVTEILVLPAAALPVVMLAFDLVGERVGRAEGPSH